MSNPNKRVAPTIPTDISKAKTLDLITALEIQLENKFSEQSLVVVWIAELKRREIEKENF